MAISVDLIQGLSGSLAVKAPCRVATTGPITASGLQTIDGVLLVADDRVLRKNETNAVNNGIWVASTSDWSRALDFNGTNDAVVGTLIVVNEGTSDPTNDVYKVDTIGIIGTDAITFVPAGASLRADLAAPGGAGLVGHLPDGVGAVASTVEDILKETISAFRFMTPAQIADVEARTYLLDVSAPVQAAATASLLPPYKKLYAPAGGYLMGTTVSIPGDAADRFYLHGDGAASEFKTTSAIPIFDIYGVSAPYATFNNATIEKIGLVAGHVSAVGIKTRWTENLKIQGNVFTGTGTGISMSSTGYEEDVKPHITDNTFKGLAKGIVTGEQTVAQRVADAWIKDNMFHNCTVSASEFGYLDGGTVTGNKVFNDHLAVYANIGMEFKKPIYVTIGDNDFFGLGGYGLLLRSPRHCRVDDNYLVGCGQNAGGAYHAIVVSDYNGAIVSDNVQFKSNTLKDNFKGGIVVLDATQAIKNYVIEDNYLYGNGSASAGTQDAISLAGVTESYVGKNRVDGASLTRNWLALDGSTDITLDDNKPKNCTVADVSRVNSPTMLIKQGTDNQLAITATTTLTFNDDTALCDATAGAIEINLPSAASCPAKIFRIGKKDASVNGATINPASSQTVDGAATLTISTQYRVVALVSDGANWLTLSSD